MNSTKIEYKCQSGHRIWLELSSDTYPSAFPCVLHGCKSIARIVKHPVIPAHGTRTAYVHYHCRCTLCTEAQRKYTEQRRTREALAAIRTA